MAKDYGVALSMFTEEIDEYDSEGSRIIGKTKRVKISVFIWCGIVSITTGIILLASEIAVGFAITLIATVTPLMFLYPLIRGLVSFGKDTLKSGIVTVIVEEWLKGVAVDKIQGKKKEKKNSKF